MNIFRHNKYAIVILHGYTMSITHSQDCFYMFDSHARNTEGMPAPNGNAVVVKCDNITDLEDYLFRLSKRLNTCLFDIVSVQLKSSPLEHDIRILDHDHQYEKANAIIVLKKQARLEKSKEYKRRKLSQETQFEKLSRLKKQRECMQRK